jgi:phosphoserine phosphatase
MNDPPRRATDVGFCLDVDGTLHRSGSVFVETLARLGFDGAMTMGAADRRHRREVIGTVVEYGAGPDSRRRWERIMWALDAVAGRGGEPLAAAAVSAIERGRALLPDRAPDDDVQPRTSAHRADGDGGLDYRTMQRRALDAYGRVIEGRRREHVERAARETVAAHVSTDPEVAATVERLQAAGATVCLVTDAPAHAARAYAEQLTGDPARVAATRYHVDDDDRYTGEYTVVDKGAAARTFRASGDWDRLVAAGDAVVDLEMGAEADRFLAVAGEGGLLTALDAPAGPDPPDCEVVRVERDESVAPALWASLAAVADRPAAGAR